MYLPNCDAWHFMIMYSITTPKQIERVLCIFLGTHISSGKLTSLWKVRHLQLTYEIIKMVIFHTLQ